MSRRSPDDESGVPPGYDPGIFERPSLTVDVALLTVRDGGLATLLHKRPAPPYQGRWALPGTFVRIDETLEAAAARALSRKAGLEGVFVEQLYTFGALSRDPRTRVVTVAYFALVPASRLPERPGASTLADLEVPWEGEAGGPVVARLSGAASPVALAFDHAEILGAAVKRLRGKLDYTPVGFELLPDRFTLAELQRVHEAVLGRPLNKDSFRRKIVASGFVRATGEKRGEAAHRPAELYRFVR